MPRSQRSYKLGTRRPDLQRRPDQYTENRWAWCKIECGQFVVFGNDSDESVTGPDIAIMVHQANRKYPSVINLTGSTVEELDALQDLFNKAFEWARPIAELRDKEAKDAFEQGDDSYARYYRQLPKLVYRKRPESEYGEGIQHRSEDVSSVDRDCDALDSRDFNGDGIRESGDGLAERDEVRGGAQDHWSSTDQPPKL